MRTMFSLTELKGRGVYGSTKKTLLERRRVDCIKQWAIDKYGESKLSEKVWSYCVTSMNAHLQKYHKDE